MPLKSNAAYIKEHFTEFCRFCMQNNKRKENKFQKLIDDAIICTGFKNIFGFELKLDENLPSNICNKCYKRLLEFLTFQKTSLNSFLQLKKYSSSDPSSSEQLEISLKNENLEIDERSTETGSSPKISDDKSQILKIELEYQTDERNSRPSSAFDPHFGNDDEKSGDDDDEPSDEVTVVVKKKSVRKKKQCTICGKVMAHLVSHMRIHLVEQQYTCHYCDAKMSTKGNLQDHMRRHHLKVKEFKCQICQKEFICAQYLQKHSIIHSGRKDHKCEVCGLAFNQKGALRSHVLQVHLNKKKFMCELCDGKFYQSFTLRHHMNTVHAERPKCKICSRVMKNQQNLAIHLRKHSGISEAVCPKCGKACVHARALLRHQLCHENTKGRVHKDYMKNAQLKNIGIYSLKQ